MSFKHTHRHQSQRGTSPTECLHLTTALLMRGSWPIGDEGNSILGRGNGRCKSGTGSAETREDEEASESGVSRAKGTRERG